MFDTQALKRDFNRAAPVYDAQAKLQRAVRARAIALGQKFWSEDARILDVGCGDGALAREVKWNLTGLDLALGMCKQSARAVNANAEALPFTDKSFDGIFSSLMLQWANDPARILREMARVTRGACVVSTFVDGSLNELKQAFAMLDDDPHVSDFMTFEELKNCAAGAGFSIAQAGEEILIEPYQNTGALMRGLKAIGASNKHEARARGLMTPDRLAQLERVYARLFGGAEGLPATWKIAYLALEKNG